MRVGLAGLVGLGDDYYTDPDTGISYDLSASSPGDDVMPAGYVYTGTGANDGYVYAPGGTVLTTAVPTNAYPATNTAAGLSTLTSLTNAALSRLTALPGQTSLQPGQSLTMGPTGTYQITASGVQPGATLGTSLSGSMPMLLLLGVGAVILLGKK